MIQRESDEPDGGRTNGYGEVADHSSEEDGESCWKRVGRVVKFDVLMEGGECVLDVEIVVEEGFRGSDEGLGVVVRSESGEELASFVVDPFRRMSSDPLADLVLDPSFEGVPRPSIEVQGTPRREELLLEEIPTLLSSFVLVDVREDESIEGWIGDGKRTPGIEEADDLEVPLVEREDSRRVA